MSFDCSKCGGMCCINPPLLRTFEEGMFAKKLGVEIVASQHGENEYLIAIAKSKDVCPFLDRETGNCSIYDNRFESCRAYECKLIGMDSSKAVLVMAKGAEHHLNTGLHTEKPKPLTRSQVRKIGAKVIRSQNKLLQKISATNISTVVAITEKTMEMVYRNDHVGV